MLNGRLTLIVDGEARDLRPGDAASVVADAPHVYANQGRHVTRFTMTVLEPLARVRP